MAFLKPSVIFAAFILFSCESKPKVVVEDAQTSTSTTSSIANTSPNASLSASASTNEMHQVTAIEILQAERYTYLRVVEKLDTFWIASTKIEAQKGNNYFYRGGLLKTDFESLEHKRIFDKIYLVSSIIEASAHPGGSEEAVVNASTPVTNDIKNVVGAVKLKDILGSKEKQAGKIIIVAGKCVKANYGIMGKNWFHIQDGTKINGKICDLTITTTESIPLGANVAFEGKIYLNKDFGAGYKYDIIMEEATLK